MVMISKLEEKKTVERSEDEYKVFIKLLQEGTNFDEWSPIKLTKTLHKDIGEVRSAKNFLKWFFTGNM